jgi:hypothetical protein
MHDYISGIYGLENYTADWSSDGKQKVTLESSVEGEANIELNLDQDPNALIDIIITKALVNVPDDRIPLLIEGKRQKINTNTGPQRTPRGEGAAIKKLNGQ